MQNNNENLKILYIEDDVIASASLLKILKMFNYSNIDHVYNAFDGLSLFKSNKYDLIITDIQTPKMTGIEFAKVIREREINLPIIFTTGCGCEIYKDYAKELNIQAYLEKPLKISSLIDVIQSLI